MFEQIYVDDVIEVALFAENPDSAERQIFNLAIRYLQPKTYKNKEGKVIEVTNLMGGETDWFIVPYTFSVSIAKTLIEQKITGVGLPEFNENGFKKMVRWLIEMEEVNDSMCY